VRTSVALDYRPALLSSAGIGRAVRELARALAREPDIDLHLFAHSLARAARAETVPASAHLHRLPIPGRSLPLLRRLGIGAEQLAGRTRVFHWTDYVHPPVRRARIVLTLHDAAFAHEPAWHGADSSTLFARTRAGIAAATAVVVPSRATAADLARHFAFAGNVHVVPFGADHVPAAAAEAPHPFAGQSYLLCLGTIEPRKNHLGLLAAWRRLGEPRPRLVVVGRPGWECANITRELQAAERAGGVHWLPAAADDRVFALLAHATALVYPSHWEGFGFPPLEAMALGVPVVANRCAAIEEVLDDAAMLCDCNDSPALAAALARVCEDAGLRRELGTRGRRRASSFTWAACARAHAAIYREVAA
jgi:glycosyltransferase involved in cell wall biosynthesis